MTEVEKKEYHKQYYQKNKEKLKLFHKQYYLENKEKLKDYYKQYYQENKEKAKDNYKQYTKTPIGRALYLLNAYKRDDKKYNRGKGDLTANWIVENIFSKPCHYCGETDWRNMGCDRIDNTLPHTKANVVPCCTECNRKKGKKSYEEWMKIISYNSTLFI